MIASEEFQSPHPPRCRGLLFLHLLSFLKLFARAVLNAALGSHAACAKTGPCDTSRFLWLLRHLAWDASQKLPRECLRRGSVISLEGSAARGGDSWTAREWPVCPRQAPGRQGLWQRTSLSRMLAAAPLLTLQPGAGLLAKKDTQSPPSDEPKSDPVNT